ncbi:MULTISPECIES: hypothetical protein [Butyricimonas]|uniref:Uncharacterized protein n=1 Tax=Butyricimonas hominis TaxID=2763032 RepID=A0ABR7D6S7_9BACT|nr:MULTISPECIES: hypothetical protein [Butyricimonas]MBC5623494.1 hypothetical protein [Butyricimonas hominis]
MWYLSTMMRGNVPMCTYRLESGVTGDKRRMIVVNNERIVEIIRGQVN